ncbi:hypothetical protein C3K47_12115 [Solitalea longa]|uniref:Bacterial Pleckstrin homology domain-containing protein n=1 Tax=Solitalea longa TaxID=2079460 RepID=A0A2S5A018_9SPHI|nr:hypothetical protein [Solitalea longa]POY35948.1 hypothetical protein C3K47_12115 [Solitalea longa]
MDNEILFKERQRFKQWWLWLALLGVNSLFLFGVFKQVIGGRQFGDKPMSNSGLLIASGITLIVMIVFINFKMETMIKKDGIYVRFFPFHLKFKFYAWDTLTKSYVRPYSPIAEYGGWGLRKGLLGSGTAYNISGNQGLQLEIKNSEKLLIGTAKPQQMAELLKKLGQEKL